MPSSREQILHWAEQGHIRDGNLLDALRAAEALPGAAQWRRFVDRLLLWLGAVSVGVGVIFFFAYNWDALGRFGKFALVQAPILVCLLALWRTGLDTLAGKAAVLIASLLVGALFALIGQTYQTGADTYQLFAVWAAAILPWALLARLPALWVLWLALVHLAFWLYLRHFGFGRWWSELGAEQRLLPHALLDMAALVLWELGARHGLRWLEGRWAPRLIATAAGCVLTWMYLFWIVDDEPGQRSIMLVWPLWLFASTAFYLLIRRDLYILSGLMLALIVVVTTAFGVWLFRNHVEFFGGLALIGLVIIGMSAAAAIWLRRLAQGESRA